MSLLFVPRPRPEQFENSPCHYEPQDDLEYVPLTAGALKTLAASLPQPISTVRYSNRENNYLFSDRESVYCPSLCSSPNSTSTSRKNSEIYTPEEGTHEIAVEIAPTFVPPAAVHERFHMPGKPIDKSPINFDSMFDIDCGGFRRASTVEFIPDYDDLDDYVLDERSAARMEEERELEKARLLYEKELEDDYACTVARKPAMSTSLWTSQPRFIMTPKFVPSPQSTELTIPVSGSTIEPSENSEFFPKSQGSTGSAASVATDITVPSEGDDAWIEVEDDFIETVFTYLSINHNSMALKFDDELAIGSGFPIEKVRKDRKAALKIYIERYVYHNPEVPCV